MWHRVQTGGAGYTHLQLGWTVDKWSAILHRYSNLLDWHVYYHHVQYSCINIKLDEAPLYVLHWQYKARERCVTQSNCLAGCIPQSMIVMCWMALRMVMWPTQMAPPTSHWHSTSVTQGMNCQQMRTEHAWATECGLAVLPHATVSKGSIWDTCD